VIPLNKNWLYTFAHLIQLVVGFILCFIFYWKFGMIGAAIGLVIAVYSNISFAGYGVSRVLSIKFYRVWPFKELGKICVVAILCSGLAYISCWFIPTNTYIQLALRLIVGVLICSGTYLFITWKLKMIDWRQLKQSLGSSIKPTETISQDTF
jgi:peptidoglycan biosynthesis protein MviN/MurJ (putative lipid II flippase)